MDGKSENQKTLEKIGNGASLVPIMPSNKKKSGPHKFEEKIACGTYWRIKCGLCGKKIEISELYFACQNCNLSCHKECRKFIGESCTGKILF